MSDEVKAELANQGWRYEYGCRAKPIQYFAVVSKARPFALTHGPDEATALCRAACLAALEQRKES